jgi:hypothetical protein
LKKEISPRKQKKQMKPAQHLVNDGLRSITRKIARKFVLILELIVQHEGVR